MPGPARTACSAGRKVLRSCCARLVSPNCPRLQNLAHGARFPVAPRPMPEVDLIVPMPLHPKRLAERGFNQALEIARGLARYRGTPIEPRGVLRVKDTPPQTELPYEDRARNVRGAFLCELDLSGASVAVLDDVMTTGATLNELARVLKRAGANRVENLVIARTVLR